MRTGNVRLWQDILASICYSLTPVGAGSFVRCTRILMGTSIKFPSSPPPSSPVHFLPTCAAHLAVGQTTPLQGGCAQVKPGSLCGKALHHLHCGLQTPGRKAGRYLHYSACCLLPCLETVQLTLALGCLHHHPAKLLVAMWLHQSPFPRAQLRRTARVRLQRATRRHCWMPR